MVIDGGPPLATRSTPTRRVRSTVRAVLAAAGVLLMAGAPIASAASTNAGALQSAITTEPRSGTYAISLPSGFVNSTVWGGLTNPVSVRFASDGRIFVAEKSGLIKVFDDLTTPRRRIFADLRGKVHDYWDRGLLGMTLDPSFPANPSVYVLYAMDAAIGATPPRWNDACPSPPGPTTDGCVIGARLSRLTAAGNTSDGSEKILIEDWCQQFPSHSVGDLRFALRWVPLRLGRRGRQLQRGGLGPVRRRRRKSHCEEPVRRPASRRRGRAVPTDRPWRVASQPERASAGRRSGLARRRDPSSRPDHGRGASDEPACQPLGPRTLAASSRTGSGTRSGSPSDPERTSSGSAMSARTRSRRSTAS